MSRVVRIVAFLIVTLALIACGPSQPAAKEGDGGSGSGTGGGGTLTRAMTTEPTSIDPHGAANAGLNLTLPYLFDTLITRQRDGKFVGHLAESWEVSPDGRTIDMKLKKGVKFHDGSPMNAAAVVFTFDRFKKVGDKSPIAANVKEISKVEALDDLTVRFSFEEPTATIWSTLAMPYAGILSPSAVQAAGDEMGSKPVGTGPFKLGEWKRGVSITLLRNPDYNWGPAEATNKGPVHIDRLVYKLIPDANTQMSALQSGDVDIIFITEPTVLDKVQKDESLKVEPINLDSLIYLGYNSAKPPFDEVKVRQALSHAINKTEIVKTALGGFGIEAGTPLPPSLLGYNKELASYGQGYDVAKAKALLAEAGFTQGSDGNWQRGGKKLGGKLLTSTRSPNEAIATVIQSQLKAIGVPVEIQQLDSAAVMKASTEGAFDLILWRYDWNDPDALNIYLSGKRVRQTNRVFYSNPQVDALLEKGLRELDPQKRAQIYEEAQKIILAEAPWQPLYHPMEGMVFRDRVKGIKVGALGRMLVNDVTLSGK
ncbi:MAG: ABC transporter substrate-binding protein [Sphingomonadaceae bacterium]